MNILNPKGNNMQEKFYISMSPEVEALITENGIDIVDELQNQNIEVKKIYASDPVIQTTNEESKTRDVTLAILASAAAISTISWSIAKILDAIGRNKKIVVTEKVTVPVTDDKGNIIKNKKGEPILRWVDRTRMIEATQTEQDRSGLKISLGGEKGLHIELGTKV